MNEQMYAQTTYKTIHHTETSIVEQITIIFDRINEKIQNLYALTLDSIADRVIQRFNL